MSADTTTTEAPVTDGILVHQQIKALIARGALASTPRSPGTTTTSG